MADDNPLSWGAKPVTSDTSEDPTSWGAKRVEGPSYWDYAKDVGKQVLSAPVRIAEGAATWPAQLLNLAGQGVEALGVTGSPENVAERAKLRELVAKQGGDKGVGQYLPKAETLPGKYAGTVADFAGGALTSPGRLAVTVPAAVTGAATSETAGQLAETAGPIAEGAARIIGAIAGTGGVLGGVGLARHFTGQGGAEIAQRRLTNAFTRDGDTPDTALQRLAQVRETRPDATLVDVAGPEVRNVLEVITQSPGPAKAITTPFLEGRQRGQMNRLVNDLTGATGTQRTAFRAIEDTMAARRTAATPLYQQAYADGDRQIWSNELERLTAAPFVRSAMRKAVTTWQNQAIADGYGAMNPTMVDRGGLITFGQSVPAFPNVQFWDYTKRMLDDMTSSALRAGQNQKARTLTTLTQQLRADLDQQVPSYAGARNAWAGPSRYMEAIEDGRSILSKNMTAEELAAAFQGMGEAEREAYRIGAVSTIRNTMGSNAAKLPDLTRAIRSPEMRAKLEVIMPSPEAAQRFNRALDYEIQSAATANQALTGSATARRLAAMEDANNLVGELAMAALPHKLGGTGLWSLLAKGPKWAQGRLRRQSDEGIARTLTSPYPASALGQQAPQGYVGGAAIGTGLGLAATPLQGDQNAQRQADGGVSRQAGGGVPAIGGIRGRSPGARALDETRKVPPGPGQALSDGGAARQQQPAYEEGGQVKQPGLRERHAAMLAATPASGPAFEKIQARKTPTGLTREDVRKTLQTFGITGEAAGAFGDRQLGERVDVDSRAEGGSVEYADGGLTRGSDGDIGNAAAALSDHPTVNAMERMHRTRMRAQGTVPAEALIDQTQKYVAEQLAGIDKEHEKEDPEDAAIEEMGGFRHPPGDGGSDEGTLPLARADGGDVERDMFRAMSRGWVDWKEDEQHLQTGGIVKLLRMGEDAARSRMLGASRGQAPIRGLPQKPLEVGGEPFIPGPSADVREAAEQYMREKGLPYTPVQNYVPQNSWVNYGPYAEKNKGASAADTVYAPQKIGAIPSWVVKQGRMTPLGVAGGAALGGLDRGPDEPDEYRFADGGEVDEPPMPDAVMDSWGDPFERAALRTKRGVLGAETMQGRGRPGDKFFEDPGQKEEAAKRVFDFTVPQTPLDLGLMALGGPFRYPVKAGALALGAMLEPSEAEAGKLGTVRKITGTNVPAAGRSVTRGHNLPPEELAPYPHFAEEYPAVGPPVMKPKTKPKFEGETYPAKQLTPEAEAFQKDRLRIQKEMDAKGYKPYFDPAQRTHVDPSNYPAANVDTLTVQPKKAATLMEYQDVINMPATRELLQSAYERGLNLGDAKNWYAMAQLEEAYVNELGPQAGRKAFLDEFAVPMSATTSGNDPETNFLLAQYAEYMRKQGRALPEEGHQLPVTVGGRRGSVNIRDYNAMRERGGYQGLGADQPKMHNFTRNIIGDPSHATIDEQMATGMSKHIQDVDPKFPDRARRQAFGLMEKPVHEAAAAAGVAPANYQDVAWAGFKNEPGKPLISTINDAIERTHRLTGMPREEIVRRGLIRKEIPIYGLTAAATPYLWGGFRPQEGGSSNPTPAGQLPL